MDYDNNNKKQLKTKKNINKKNINTKNINTKNINTKKAKTNKNKTKYNIFYKAVSFAFNEIAIKNKWPKKHATKAVEEYFNILKKNKNNAKSTLTKMSGGAHPMLDIFINWMRAGAAFGIQNAIGTFDTPCNIIISFISIGTWCVVLYNKINNIVPEEAKHSLAQPVQYVLFNKMPDAYYMEEQITNIMIDYVETKVGPQIPLLDVNVSTIVELLRTLFWESTLYNIFIVKQISCLLAPFIVSCNVNCQINRISRSSSSRSSKSRSRSTKSKSTRSSKSKSKYFTPPERM
jgi:hypothetical protein